MATVRADSLTKRFGDLLAVDSVDLSLEAGEFFALLGPSGCGKTTTLRLIAGLELPTSGSLHLGGRDVTNVPPHRRDIGMVFQNYALFPHLTVFGNVAYGLRARRVPKADVAPRVERALARVDLAGYGDRKVSALSGGQQQRVAVARAIVLEPGLLLLDEPLSNLDARLRLETREELRTLQHSLGFTTLHVTHDQDEALTLADRLGVMHGGRLRQVGSPAEVYQRPADSFVAAFIGQANLVPVTVEAGGDPAPARLPSGEVVTVGNDQQLPAGAAAVLCARPEALTLGDDGPAATVVDVVFSGPRYDYTVATADGTAWRLTVPNRGQRVHAAGDATRLGLTPAVRLLRA